MRNFLVLSFTLVTVTFTSHTISNIKASRSTDDIASTLDWIPDATLDCNTCGGHYRQSPILTGTPHPLAPGQEATEISSEGPTTYQRDGVVILLKHIVITQPGRVITAEKAVIHRNPQTGKVQSILLSGDVHLEENGKRMVTQQLLINNVTGDAHFEHIIYHLAENTIPGYEYNKHYNYDAFGTAQKAIKTPDGVLHLWKATFSTCSPTHPSWQIYASSMTLDKAKNKGKAKNIILRFKHIPIFYTPYFSFPLNRAQRKSGILVPTYSFSNTNGFSAAVPVYWNMAPNYDMTITPKYLSYRGLLTTDVFRYLTPSHMGNFAASFLPSDRVFNTFRNDQMSDYPNPTPGSRIQPFINALKRETDNRGYFSWNDFYIINDFWSAQIQLNYVTDPYFFSDLSVAYNSTSANQLLNQINLNYNGYHWTFEGMVQAYQTLHMINQADVANQYMRLPELDADANYPYLWGNLDFNLNAQSVYFDYASSFAPTTETMPIGGRIHLRPGLSRSFNWGSGYITPQVWLDNTDYFTQLPIPTGAITRPDFTESRNIPIVDIKGGLYIDRNFDFLNHDFIQTLEPELFYLGIPYVNQNQYPDFDTQLLPFSYGDLFALNSYSGYDRLQNANQMSFGLTSRILNSETGEQNIMANLGLIYYFAKPSILLPGASIDTGTVSPLVGSLTFALNHLWSIGFNGAWSFLDHNVNNTGASLYYNHGGDHIATIGYEYVRNLNGQPFDSLGLSTSTQLVDGGLAWPLTSRWSLLGYLYYNIVQNRPENYFAGLQYGTCCWAVRVVANRTFQSIATNSVPGHIVNQYSNQFYVQLLLKGLTTFDNSNPSDVLQSALPGYYDPFNSPA